MTSPGEVEKAVQTALEVSISVLLRLRPLAHRVAVADLQAGFRHIELVHTVCA